MPSHSELLTDSFNLNFGLEVNEYTYGVMQNTIYQRSWSDYIGDMFSIKRRNYEMEGILPPNLLNNLRLNDRLIIKGTRYIINKITSNLVDRRDQLELINDIYNAPLVSDVLNTSFFRQTRQVFDKGAHAYSFTYVGLSGKAINAVDLNDGTGFVRLGKTKLQLTFLINFSLDYELSIIRKVGTGTITNTWTWVAARSAPFEVTESLPSPDPLDISTIEFANAINLDLPNLYDIEIIGNQLVITANNFDEEFIGVSAKDDNGVLLTPNVDYAFAISESPITTSDDLTEINYSLFANNTGNERRIGIQVVDNINNPVYLVIQQA
jgi:hypothetical protein